MKRRRVLQSILSLPAITAVPGLAQEQPAPPADEHPKLEFSAADAAAEPVRGFFNASELAVLRHLADLLVPAANGKPGALDAGVPEFLDFLIAESPGERQTLYKEGLNRLESDAQRRFHQPFAALHSQQADELLAALHQPWTFGGPSDPLARFLQAAKQDVLRATLNSRESITASASRRGGVGSYWYSME